MHKKAENVKCVLSAPRWPKWSMLNIHIQVLFLSQNPQHMGMYYSCLLLPWGLRLNSNSATLKNSHTFHSVIRIHHTHPRSIPLLFLSWFLSSSLSFTPQCLYCSFSGHFGSFHRVNSLLLRHYISLHSDSGNRFWSVYLCFSAPVNSPHLQPRVSRTLSNQTQ